MVLCRRGELALRYPVRLLASSLCLAAALAARADDVRDSALSGRLMSASASIPAHGTSAALLRVPSDRAFVLTQLCTGWTVHSNVIVFPAPVDPVPRVVASVLGVLPAPAASGALRIGSPRASEAFAPVSGCSVFEPGLVLAPGESLACETSAPANPETVCLVTGVLLRDRGDDR